MSDAPRMATLDWIGGERFEGGKPDGPRIRVDGEGKEAPSPVTQLLMAAAACTGIDVVMILQKFHLTLHPLPSAIRGRRRDHYPRRFLDLHLVFTLKGDGLEDHKARRAIELSITKYCTVINTLNPDIPITWDLHLE